MIEFTPNPIQQHDIEQMWCLIKDTPIKPAECAVIATVIAVLAMNGLTPVQCVDVVLHERAPAALTGCERQLLDMVIDAMKQRECTEQDIADYVGTLAQGFALITAGSQSNAHSGVE